MPALLCVPIMVQDEPTSLADAHAARDAGADLVEFRIDEFFSGLPDAQGNLDQREVAAVLRIVARSPLPCIVTCRSAAEGGHYDGDETARVSLYERLGTAGVGSSVAAASGAEHPPRYLDFEYAAYTRSANLRQKVNLAVDHPRQRRDVRTGLILSMHDFESRPRDLLRRLADMQAEPAASIVKAAYTVRSIRDNLELLDLAAENTGPPLIALGMGRFGLMSRVLAPKFGGFLTFASLRRESATAPGQPTLRELLDTYRFRSIHPGTRVFGLIGWPVEHSLSPLVHNAGFDTLAPDEWDPAEGDSAALDGVYLPMPVPPEYEHFKATLSAFIDHPRLDFCGCSVTIPHKQHLVRFARERSAAGDDLAWEIDALAAASGAANTLVVQRDRVGLAVKARVLNTDAAAAVSCLESALNGSARGRRITLIGAGGVARAIAAGLLEAGASVLVAARTRANAEALAADLRASGIGEGAGASISAADLDAASNSPCDALVNCTPVGMSGGPDPKSSPVNMADVRRASPDAVIMDTVYNPLNTPLLEQAGLAGLKTLDGLRMFVAQAADQFEAWTGRPAPVGLFDRICREALSVSER